MAGKQKIIIWSSENKTSLIYSKFYINHRFLSLLIYANNDVSYK